MIAENHQYFNSRIEVAQLLYDAKLYEDCINYLAETSGFAHFNFPGVYCSPEIEILLEKVSDQVFPSPPVQQKAASSKQILHLCSELYSTGGHTKLLFNWIKNDNHHSHSVFATWMEEDTLREIAKQYIDITEVDLIGGFDPSKLETAKKIREFCYDFDFIILHIHPHDVIPNLALANLPHLPPILFLNHADHVFWLGTRILDYLIQIRDANIPLDEQRRGIPATHQFFLPIPVEAKISDVNLSKNNTFHLLSTGTHYKYEPNAEYNFLQEARQVVEKFPQVVFHIVGISKESEYAKAYQHERLLCHGILQPAELAKLEAQSDLYVEGFPMASFTALLQVALQKKPFILHYNALPIFQLFQPSQKAGIHYPKNVEDWRTEISRLIQEEKYLREITGKQYHYLQNHYSIAAWKDKLTHLYQTAQAGQHPIVKEKAKAIYSSANEQLLVGLNKITVDHYRHTFQLKFWGRLKVWKKSYPKSQHGHYFSKSRKVRLKHTLGYLFKR